jgi:hypothetical protein
MLLKNVRIVRLATALILIDRNELYREIGITQANKFLNRVSRNPNLATKLILGTEP